MAKRYRQPIRVYKAANCRPACFFWRGRRYEIMEVINRWAKSTEWWRGNAAVDQQYATVLARICPGEQVGTYELCFDRLQSTWMLTKAQD